MRWATAFRRPLGDLDAEEGAQGLQEFRDGGTLGAERVPGQVDSGFLSPGEPQPGRDDRGEGVCRALHDRTFLVGGAVAGFGVRQQAAERPGARVADGEQRAAAASRRLVFAAQQLGPGRVIAEVGPVRELVGDHDEVLGGQVGVAFEELGTPLGVAAPGTAVAAVADRGEPYGRQRGRGGGARGSVAAGVQFEPLQHPAQVGQFGAARREGGFPSAYGGEGLGVRAAVQAGGDETAQGLAVGGVGGAGAGEVVGRVGRCAVQQQGAEAERPVEAA